MKLTGPISKYLDGEHPSHSARNELDKHIKFIKRSEIESSLIRAGLLDKSGKITDLAKEKGAVDVCGKSAIWNIKKTKLALLDATRKKTVRKTATPVKLAGSQAPTNRNTPKYTDLENIGTYFGVGKLKVGKWLDDLGLRGYKPRQINESGDVDMLDIANESKEKFRAKIPTEKAIEQGYAIVETIEYKKKGKDESFQKYSWDLEKVKSILVRAGHELDTERKLLLKGKGKNSDVKVSSLDSRAAEVYRQWKKLYESGKTEESWKLVEKQAKPIQALMEQKIGWPGFFSKKLYRKPSNLKKLSP